MKENLKEPQEKNAAGKGSFLTGLELGLEPPVQIWGNHTVYYERCAGVLDFGEGYIRFTAGKVPVTVFGADVRVEEYKAGRLLVRGHFSAVEFG